MTTYWAEYAQLPTGLANRVRITVTDGLITSVKLRRHREPDDVWLSGVVMPGFANGHSHAFHRALRGRSHGDGGNFWTWREQMYAVARRLTPDTYYDLAVGVYAEMVKAGYTTVGEFHYVHHDPEGNRYADPNAMGQALIAAAKEAGIRITLLDTVYLAGGLGGTGHLELDEVQQRFTDGDVAGWADRVGGLTSTRTARIGAAVHSVRAVPKESLQKLAAASGDLVMHAHVSEQPGENAAAQMFYGATPTQLLGDAGLLSSRFTAVHATHLTAEDIAQLGAATATACFCPTTERDLADGIGPARELADAGVALSLGSDQQAVIDPFEEVRGLEMHERLLSGERGRFTIPELLTASSAAGYASLGWPDGGAIAVGKLADFVVVRTDSMRTVGCRPNQVVFAATEADVTHTVVDGELVVREGAHRLGDLGLVLARALDPLRMG